MKEEIQAANTPNNIGYIYNEKTETFLPDLKSEEMNLPSLGKFGMLRKKYLWEHKAALYSELAITGRLFTHCHETEKSAEQRLNLIIEQMKQEQGLTEQYKATHQMEWVGLMNNVRAAAEEIVLNELIYS